MSRNTDNPNEYYMNKAIANYKNGNYAVIILQNGTKIRYNEEDVFIPDHFESVDIKITNQCPHNCLYCHEASHPTGEHADLNKYMSFMETIHPYTELAIGGGNPLLHPQLDSFLQYCKDKKFIPSMTVNWKDFIEEHERILKFTQDGLLYGIGVSMPTPDTVVDKQLLYSYIQDTPNTVCHLILGIHDLVSILEISHMIDSPRVLFLGYKSFRRGSHYLDKYYGSIDNNIHDIRSYISRMKQGLVKDLHFNPMAFDNLALQQLQMNTTDYVQSPFYMGDDGQFTLFLDLVNGEYAKSSTSEDRFPIENKSADQIFEHIRTGK